MRCASWQPRRCPGLALGGALASVDAPDRRRGGGGDGGGRGARMQRARAPPLRAAPRAAVAPGPAGPR
jgi:hypothetical protein